MTDGQLTYLAVSILDLDSLIEFAKKRRAELIERMQTICPHASIAVAPYRPEGLVCFAQPPFAVCLRCGYAEEHWGCGPIALSLDRPHVEMLREQARLLARPVVLSNDDAVARARRLGLHGWHAR